MKRGIAAALLVLAAGCSGSDGTELPHPSSVDWSQVDQSVKDRIDSARRGRDCAEMQELFNDAADNGLGSDLLSYIDDSLKYAGCY